MPLRFPSKADASIENSRVRKAIKTPDNLLFNTPTISTNATVKRRVRFNYFLTSKRNLCASAQLSLSVDQYTPAMRQRVDMYPTGNPRVSKAAYSHTNRHPCTGPANQQYNADNTRIDGPHPCTDENFENRSADTLPVTSSHSRAPATERPAPAVISTTSSPPYLLPHSLAKWHHSAGRSTERERQGTCNWADGQKCC